MRSIENLTVIDRERVLALAQNAKLKRKSSPKSPIIPVDRNRPLELSFAQQRLWFLAQLEEASKAYHIASGLRLKGELDRAALRKALDRIIARHEALRTTFSKLDGRPVQVIGPAESGFHLQEHDLRQGADSEAELLRLAAREIAKPFDLEHGPLIRGQLAQLAEDDHALLMTMHHIISDGWSMGVLVNELSALYKAYRSGEADSLPDLPIQYADYAAWQRTNLSGEVVERQAKYWKKTLAGAPTLLELPTDRPRPARQDYAGGAVEVELEEDLTRKLKALGQRHGATLYMTLLAGWALLLARLSGEDDVVIGSPVANRTRTEIEPLVGFFVNTLALRIDVSGSPSVVELLGRVKSLAVEAQQHQDIPFEQVVESVQPPRSPAHGPIFQVMFALQGAPEGALDLPKLTITSLDAPHMTAKFDLSLLLEESGNRVVGCLEYAGALFDPATARRYLGYWRRLIEAMVEDEAEAVDRLPLLGETERRQVLVEWNATEADYPREKCVHELFEARVKKTPDAIALVCGDQSLSYRELNAQANRLARRLRGLGVEPGGRVAILLERSMNLVIAEIATLKLGAAYVPIDPSFPAERQVFMVADSEAQVVVTSRNCSLPESLAAPRVEIEDWRRFDAVAHNLNLPSSGGMTAYVIYTSGSTGKPKGVMVPHRAIGRLVLNCGYADFEAGDRVVFAANPAFDASTMEVWAPLLNGGRIVVVDQDSLLEPSRFAEVLNCHEVSVLWMTVGLFNQYAEALSESFSRLRYLIVGGDALSPHVIAEALRDFPPRHLVNGYGPTETTTFAITHEIREVAEGAVSIPLGRPISNTQTYIVDGSMQPSPIGASGEIYIGGAGVAQGYLKRPELTAERFVPDPFGRERGGRVYRTGDLGRWLPEGVIEFLGRNDFQVKIRGFRVELGEIETGLTSCPGVREAVVLARADDEGGKRLVAYYTGKEIGAEALRAHLSSGLPEYMVPSAYVYLESLPLTPNGKLDRRALPAPDDQAYVKRGYEPPVGETETLLARIWAELLHLERVGRHDNFFELGGHSLLASGVLSRLQQTGRDLPPTELFAHPTLADFALAVERSAQVKVRPVVAIDRDRPLELSFAQQRLWFLAQIEGASEAYHIHNGLRLKGELDLAALRRALDRIIARHEALRTTFSQIDGRPVQVIGPAESGFHLQEHDLSRSADAETELRRLTDREATQPFDLEHGPLIRGRLARLAEDDHALLLTMHHIVSDGWSMGVLENELSALYKAYRSGQADPLPYLPVQYADYAAWQRGHLSGEVLRRQAEYWKNALAEAPALLELPADRPRPARQNYAGAAVDIELDEEFTRGLKALGRRRDATLYMTLLAGWAALLARLSGQDDVVIGSPVANRARTEIEPLIGFFVNTLALRIDVSGSPTVGELLGRVKARALEAQQHQDIPFEQVVEIAQPVRSLGHAPVFQTMFVWQNAPEGAFDLPGLTITHLVAAHVTAQFDVSLALWEDDQRIAGRLEFATALFDPATVRRYVGYWRALLEAMVTNEDQAVDRLPLLGEAERRQVLEEWNATEADCPKDKFIHELFEEQVERRPEAVALEQGNQNLSYWELNAQANRLARHLSKLGVGPDTRVAICVERGFEMVVALLATLKAGGAYVPMDTAYPSERLAYMLEDCAPLVLLTTKAARIALAGCSHQVPILDLDHDATQWADQSEENLDHVSAGSDARRLAYIIYTSGSTGLPKGVMVERQELRNSVIAQQSFAVDPESRILQLASFSFDVCAFELTLALCHGALLALPQRGAVLAGESLARAVKQYDISHVAMSPTALASLPRNTNLDSVRVLAVGIEALSRELARRWAPGRRMVNGYGPTETTIWATQHECRAEGQGAPPIGSPIANARAYIFDAHLQPVPIGAAGEIYIGGAGVARGYRNRPELTAERFVPDPFNKEAGARVYKTGDLGRWLPDGQIEFMGRTDSQVKIRGFRVELGEIEARLAGYAGVREAVVTVWEDEGVGKRLAAYYTGEKVEIEALRDHLSSRLPEYMVPSAYIWLESLPLMPNGKLDRRALPAPDDQAYVKRGYEPPVGETETLLARIWAELLHLERVGRHDNFFELGGHSLLATGVLSRLQQTGRDLSLTELFAHPTLADFALAVEQSAQVEVPPVTAIDRDRPLELSFAQQRLWFLAQLEGVSEAYHIPSGLRLKGELDRAALRKALDRIIARHEALRTTFSQINGRPVQVIGPAESGFHLQEHDLRQGADSEAELLRLAAREFAKPFDLEHGPLIRGRLAQLAEGDHALLMTMHHIVSDGWSWGVLVNELSALYKAYRSGEADSLPDVPVQYADYAAWQRTNLSGKVLGRQAEYWKNVLAGAPALLELPTDRPRLIRQDYAGAAVEVELEEDLTRKLKALGQRHGATLYMTLLAGWAALLARLSGQDDVVIGSPVANRSRSEIEPLIGLFVNTLALRIDVSGSPSVVELIERVKSLALEAHQRQDVPFEQVVEIVQPPRSMAHAPVFQVMFALQNTPVGTLDLPGLTITRVDAPQMTAKFDLSLLLKEDEDRIVGVLIYAGALFEPATARRYLGYWRRLLDAMVEDEAEAVDRLPLLEEAERRQILDDWNATEADYPRERCIHELFEAQAEARPEAVALICENQSLSYRELNARANRLARRLRELGVRPDARVAICMERGLEMVVALLATLKAGGAYAPLDPAYPPERLAYMLEDCAPAVLITYGPASEKLTRYAPALPILDLGSDAQQWKSLSGDNLTRAEIGLDTRSLAYVIYTSGSTGAPKGVMIRHDSALNLLTALSRAIYAHYDPHLRISLNAPLAFDASVKQLVQLLAGHTLCVIPEDMRLNGVALLNYIESHQIEVFDSTPSQLRLLLEARRVREPRASGSAEFPRVALVGGEAIDAQLWRQMGDDTVTSYYNVYGPTECTVDATARRVGKDLEQPTIGSPLANTAAHILDAEMRMVPIGVTGELYLGGAGVAQGYLNRPDLTAERFLPDPYGRERGGRVYRTGDLGRWLPDGVIEFLGRNDSQVKVRGFRIELGEIEACLTSCPSVREAVVIAREDDEGSKRLVAYYTGEEIGAEALRSHLSSMLPEYMLPTAYARLQALPLTPNGKLDRRRLPVPEGAAYVRRGYEPPEGETETELARIWAETLGLDRVGRYDNFFELGGHSLLAVKLVNQCKQMQIAVSIADLFMHPTIESLAAYVQAQKDELFNKRSAAIPLRTGGAEAPLFLVHDISGEMFYGPKLTPHLAPGFPVYGLVAPGFSETPLLTVQAMAARMARMIRATQPEGPYRLAGWSFGATLAYEIATQLIGDDATVEFLGSLDGYYLGPGTNTSREALPDDLAQAFQELSLIPAEMSGDEAQQYVGRYRSNMLAARSYVAHPIPIPLHLFAADETEGAAHAPALRNWEVAMPAEQIRLISVPGNHLSMMEPSHIEPLGEALSRALRQARETVEALGANPPGLAGAEPPGLAGANPGGLAQPG